MNNKILFISYTVFYYNQLMPLKQTSNKSLIKLIKLFVPSKITLQDNTVMLDLCID